MVTKKFITVAGAIMLCTAQQETASAPIDKMDNKCGMPLPSIESLSGFQGPASGPFLLDQDKAPDTLTILSMNIQGLPNSKAQNPDYRDDRYDCLSDLAEPFDLVAYQENFWGTLPIEQKRKSLHTNFNLWTTGMMSASFRSGLSFNGRVSFTKAGEKPYSGCHGWLGGKNDCLAMKGYEAIEVSGVKFFNTHLDAGDLKADQDMRISQLEELSKALPETGDVVVMGDLNTSRRRPRDEAAYRKFIRENNLQEIARSRSGLDVILVRGVKVNWTGTVGNDLLSDHKGLVANLTLNPA